MKESLLTEDESKKAKEKIQEYVRDSESTLNVLAGKENGRTDEGVTANVVFSLFFKLIYLERQTIRFKRIQEKPETFVPVNRSGKEH